MGLETHQIRTCDAPQCLRVRSPLTEREDRLIENDEEHIDALAYADAVFHKGCWMNMSAPHVQKVLDLDDIVVANPDPKDWRDS